MVMDHPLGRRFVVILLVLQRFDLISGDQNSGLLSPKVSRSLHQKPPVMFIASFFFFRNQQNFSWCVVSENLLLNLVFVVFFILPIFRFFEFVSRDLCFSSSCS